MARSCCYSRKVAKAWHRGAAFAAWGRDVVGRGGGGLNVIQGAALCSPSRIIAVDMLPTKLDMAKRFGATDTIAVKDVDDVPEAIRSLTDGLGVDYAFEASGVTEVIAQSFRSVQRGGTAVVVGVPGFDQMASIPAALLVLEEKAVVGSLYGSANMRRDMPRLLELYMRKKLKIDELISRRITLDEINAAFDAIKQGEVARSVIVYQ